MMVAVGVAGTGAGSRVPPASAHKAHQERRPASYVDLHLHLLPGVDDGPRNLAQSLRRAEKMVAAGVGEATLTPHVGHPRFAVDPASIPERTEALQGALDVAGIPLRRRLAGELPAGALLRVNVCSPLGAHGASAQASAVALVRSWGSTSSPTPTAPIGRWRSTPRSALA